MPTGELFYSFERRHRSTGARRFSGFLRHRHRHNRTRSANSLANVAYFAIEGSSGLVGVSLETGERSNCSGGMMGVSRDCEQWQLSSALSTSSFTCSGTGGLFPQKFCVGGQPRCTNRPRQTLPIPVQTILTKTFHSWKIRAMDVTSQSPIRC